MDRAAIHCSIHIAGGCLTLCPCERIQNGYEIFPLFPMLPSVLSILRVFYCSTSVLLFCTFVVWRATNVLLILHTDYTRSYPSFNAGPPQPLRLGQVLISRQYGNNTAPTYAAWRPCHPGTLLPYRRRDPRCRHRPFRPPCSSLSTSCSWQRSGKWSCTTTPPPTWRR